MLGIAVEHPGAGMERHRRPVDPNGGGIIRGVKGRERGTREGGSDHQFPE